MPHRVHVSVYCRTAFKVLCFYNTAATVQLSSVQYSTAVQIHINEEKRRCQCAVKLYEDAVKMMVGAHRRGGGQRRSGHAGGKRPRRVAATRQRSALCTHTQEFPPLDHVEAGN